MQHVTLVATHSSHVLKGIVDETTQLQIIRLSRVDSSFCGYQVSQDSIRECIKKPSTKVETILDGLFAEAVTIVEGEGDRLVYSTTWERLYDHFEHDVHFVSVGGTSGFADTCALYRNLNIPVCAIADLDLMNEAVLFERIIQVLNGVDASEAIATCSRAIIARIVALGPALSEEELRQMLRSLCKAEPDWSDMARLGELRRTLAALRSALSPTAKLKGGLNGLKPDPIFDDLNALLERCRGFGLLMVPCGELENWVPTLMEDGPSKNKKSEWATAAANKIREAPVQADDIWGFITQMGGFHKDEARRLNGLPDLAEGVAKSSST